MDKGFGIISILKRRFVLRVISGTARGKKLISPKDERVRPTLDRVKENIFNILGNMRDKKILDLFSGSGALGIEALSRGAKICYFCDLDKESVKLTKQNLKATRLEEKGVVVNDDAINFISKLYTKKEKFDYIFLDPPYADGLVARVLEQLQKYDIMQNNGILIIETDKEELLDDEFGFEKIKERVYSKTRISFFSKRRGIDEKGDLSGEL